jgi:hypothetical protein
VLRFCVIWAYLECWKDLPHSQEPLNVAPKGKLSHGLDINPIQNTIWTECFAQDLAQIFMKQSDHCASWFETIKMENPDEKQLETQKARKKDGKKVVGNDPIT